MIFRKNKLFLLSFLLLPFLCNNSLAQEILNVQSLILEGSKLRINGTSNVTDFECIYNGELESDTLNHVMEISETISVLEGNTLFLEIDSFDCGRRGINKDFRKNLQSKVYPTIQIELKSIIPQHETSLKAEVLTTLAGISQLYTLELARVFTSNEVLNVEGALNLKMSDFKISPPTALFGLIKTHDDLQINFSLKITQ